MSIEEIIKRLQEVGMFDCDDEEDKQAIREAIAMLKTHPEAQPNEPLTPEELRGMVGKWVWVTVHYKHCDCSGWALICTGASLGYLEQLLNIADCGTKFDAYRRPPEEEQHGA